MKEDWKECKLGEVLVDNGYIRGPFGSALKRGDMKSEGIPVYEQQHAIYQIRDFRFFIDEKKFQEMKRFQVNENDLVISCSGTVGKITIISKNDPKGIISQALLILRVNPNIILPKYLQYFFISTKGYNSIISRSSGSVQVNIAKRNIIESIPLFLPPLATQQKIATILSSLDDKIELNNKINDNLEQQAQGIFKSWFVDFEPFGGKMPEGWKECKAEEYFEITIGKTPPRKEQEWFSEEKTNQTMKWVSISDMGSCGLFISDSSEYLTTEAVAKFNVKVVPANTIILSFKLTVGRIAITDDEMCTNEAIAHFGTKNKVINEYLYLYLKNFNYQTMGSTSSIATAVNSKIIKAMPFILPDEKTINDFHLATNSLFEKIRENQHENHVLSTIRDTLLPKLMNGEIEV